MYPCVLQVPGELEAEIQGEAEEFAILHMVEAYKRLAMVAEGGGGGEVVESVFVRPEVHMALQAVMGCSVSEISKAYGNVVNGYWWKEFQ